MQPIEKYKKIDVAINGNDHDFYCHNNEFSEAVCLDILRGDTYPIIPLGEEIRTILDIGANVGAATVYFKGCYPGASVYSFEPHYESFCLLQENTKTLDHVHAFNYGLSDSEQDARLFIGGIDSVTNSIFAANTNTSEYENIKIRNVRQTILELGIQSIDILKVDTEGCEVNIITALFGYLKNVKLIYLEYHSEDDRLLLDSILCRTHYLCAAKCDLINRGEVVYVNKSEKTYQACCLKDLPSGADSETAQMN